MRKSRVVLLVMLMGSLVVAVAQADSAGAAVGPCPKYTPGGDGVGKPIKIVTDSRTKNAPLTFTVQTAPGAGFSSATQGDEIGAVSHVFTNVQVNTNAAQKKLFVRVQFPAQWDYDLFLRDKYRKAVAYAAGFNQVVVPGDPFGLDGTGHGGHSEVGAEQLDGILTKDCAGYTVHIVSASTTGGPVTVKYWLAA